MVNGSAKKRQILSDVQKNCIITTTELTSTIAATIGECKRRDGYLTSMDNNGVKFHIQELTLSSFSILAQLLEEKTPKRKRMMNVDHGVPTINNDDGNIIHQSNSKKKANQRHYKLWNTRMHKLASY